MCRPLIILGECSISLTQIATMDEEIRVRLKFPKSVVSFNAIRRRIEGNFLFEILCIDHDRRFRGA